MLITIATISILAISALAWLANRVLPFTVCPICAGVLLTWIGLVGARFLGYEVALVVPALLMGGSVVGMAYQLEKKFHNSSVNTFLLWKALFIPAGFVVAYSVLDKLWAAALLAFAFMFLISIALLPSRGESASGLEKKMEDCC